MNAPTTRVKIVAGQMASRIGLSRFRRDETGATAIEFGLVALPFFALMFAILETALMFFAGQAMDTAVSQAARMIRTGQAQQQSFDLNKFKSQVCSQIVFFTNCVAGLKVDVEKYATFDSINLGLPLDASGNLNAVENFVPGQGKDIVVVRAYYEWPVIVNKLGNNLATLADGNHLLVATAAFRNEPFPW